MTPSAYVLVGHVPVGPLPERHHLPHDDAIAPDVAGRGELAVGDGLRRCPPDRDLPPLRKKGREAEKWHSWQKSLDTASQGWSHPTHPGAAGPRGPP